MNITLVEYHLYCFVDLNTKHSVTRSLNIVAILTKQRPKNKLLSIKTAIKSTALRYKKIVVRYKKYIRLTHARSHFRSKYIERSCKIINQK